jgi:hypothetical protein
LVSAYLELAPGPWSPDEQMELALADARRESRVNAR